MQKYEAIFVISTKQDEESIKATVEKFSTLISENGTLTSVDEWGKRKLKATMFCSLLKVKLLSLQSLTV